MKFKTLIPLDKYEIPHHRRVKYTCGNESYGGIVVKELGHIKERVICLIRLIVDCAVVPIAFPGQGAY